MISRASNGRGRKERGAHLLAVVQLAPDCDLDLAREMAGVAHAASRRGAVVLVVPAIQRDAANQALEAAARRTGVYGPRVRILSPREAGAELSSFGSVEVIVSPHPAALQEALGAEPREVLSPGPGLRRLRELGRDPVVTGPDPIFRPLVAQDGGRRR